MMTSEELKQLVSDTERESVLLAAGLSGEVVIQNLQNTEMGYSFEDLFFLIASRLGSYLPILYLYLKLLETESKLYNPVMAYAYGKQAQAKKLDYREGLLQYHSIIGKSKEAALCENVGKYAAFLRTIFGAAPDERIHPVDQLASLYRQIYGAVGTSEDIFYRCGYKNQFQTVK